ncbi:MAG: cytochrome c [Steroidobacteraceae bacterium]
MRPITAIRMRTARMRAAIAAVFGLLTVSGMQAPVQAQTSRMFFAQKLTTTNGAEIYQHICQGCHMPDGQGAAGAGRYPALAKNSDLKSPTFMALTILDGRSNMPAFGAKHGAGAMFFSPPTLTYEQVAAVINYVRTHFGNHYTGPISAAQVEALDNAP